MREEDFRGARRTFNKIAQTYPDKSIGHYSLGNLEVEEGNLGNALLFFKKAEALDKNSWKIKAALASVQHGELGNVDEAISNYEKAISLEDKDCGLLTDLAACQKRKNLILKAWGNLKKAIELDPSYAFAHYTIGKLYLEQELLRRHKMHFDTAIQLDSKIFMLQMASVMCVDVKVDFVKQ